MKRGGLTWRSQVGANPIPIPRPTNLALFGHRITLYRFNQRAHTIAGGLKSEQGAKPPHFEHCVWHKSLIYGAVNRHEKGITGHSLETLTSQLVQFTVSCSSHLALSFVRPNLDNNMLFSRPFVYLPRCAFVFEIAYFRRWWTDLHQIFRVETLLGCLKKIRFWAPVVQKNGARGRFLHRYAR